MFLFLQNKENVQKKLLFWHWTCENFPQWVFKSIWEWINAAVEPWSYYASGGLEHVMHCEEDESQQQWLTWPLKTLEASWRDTRGFSLKCLDVELPTWKIALYSYLQWGPKVWGHFFHHLLLVIKVKKKSYNNKLNIFCIIYRSSNSITR